LVSWSLKEEVSCAIVFSVVLMTSLIFGCINGSIEGSEEMATEKREFTGFNQLDIGWGFEANVTRGSEFSISITANENVLDSVLVSKSGGKLKVGMKSATYNRLQLRVDITMPELVEVELSGGSDATVSGFGAQEEFRMDLSGGSSIQMDGSADRLQAESSGGSRMHLSNFQVVELEIEMSGGGRATVRVSGRIDGDLSGGSHLYYIGNPTMGNIKKSGGSSVQEE